VLFKKALLTNNILAHVQTFTSGLLSSCGVKAGRLMTAFSFPTVDLVFFFFRNHLRTEKEKKDS